MQFPLMSREPQLWGGEGLLSFASAGCNPQFCIHIMNDADLSNQLAFHSLVVAGQNDL